MREKTPPSILIAIDGFAGVQNGADVFVKRGERLRADDPRIAGREKFFVGDGASDAELFRARAKLRPGAEDE